MRIKEEIKRDGIFWFRSSPETQATGTLSISDGGNVKLQLTEFTQSLGSIQRLLRDDSEGLNQILGYVEKNGPVTIDRCYRTMNQRSIVPGRLITSHVIWANRAYVGFECDERESPRFNSVSFSIEGIDEWVGVSGIEVDRQVDRRALTISYNKPTDISFNLQNSMQLLITFASTFPRFPTIKRAEVSQKTYFRLISKEACELEEFISIAEKITAFLCFVMNQIVCLDRIRATSDSLRQSLPGGRTVPIPVEIYCSSWPYAKNTPEIDEFDMLFKFTRIQSRAESIFNTWIENYEQIAPALDLYFLTKTGTLPSWNSQFLTLVQALEAFHRRTSDEVHMDEDKFKEVRKKLIKQCPKEERGWFAPKLQYANALTLRNRFEKMTEPFSNFMGGEIRPRLIDRIVKTRNYLTHYDSDLESEAAKGKVLQFLCRKMDALFRLQFLKTIGFDEREIDATVDKCPNLNRECNLM